MLLDFISSPTVHPPLTPERHLGGGVGEPMFPLVCGQSHRCTPVLDQKYFSQKVFVRPK